MIPTLQMRFLGFREVRSLVKVTLRGPSTAPGAWSPRPQSLCSLACQKSRTLLPLQRESHLSKAIPEAPRPCDPSLPWPRPPVLHISPENEGEKSF